MTVPAYWSTEFRKSITAPFTDVASWLTAIRTMLTVTLPVGSRWTESNPGVSNSYTSPADPVNGNVIGMNFTRTSAVRLYMLSFYQVPPAAGAGILQGECDISGTVQANIFAGPFHFWTEVVNGGLPNGDFMGVVGVATVPEPENQITNFGFGKHSRNVAQNPFNLQADMWMTLDANVDGGFPVRARCQGPYFVANAAGYDLFTAAGSPVYYPAVGVTYPTLGSNANTRFCGTFPQFVWVDKSWLAGQFVPVPIDVGVTGIFQVVSSLMTPSNGGSNGAKLAIRVA